MKNDFLAYDIISAIRDLSSAIDGKIDTLTDHTRNKIMAIIIILMRNGDFTVEELLEKAKNMGAPVEEACIKFLAKPMPEHEKM